MNTALHPRVTASPTAAPESGKDFFFPTQDRQYNIYCHTAQPTISLELTLCAALNNIYCRSPPGLT